MTGARKGIEVGCGHVAAYDGVGQIREAIVVVASMVAEHVERGPHVEPEPFAHHALRLLYHDPAVQRVGQLVVDNLRFLSGAMLKDRDSGYIGEGLGQVDICLSHLATLDVKEIES